MYGINIKHTVHLWLDKRAWTRLNANNGVSEEEVGRGRLISHGTRARELDKIIGNSRANGQCK